MISVPATVTVPESGFSSPAMTMSSVDLPEPEGPTSPTDWPWAMVSDSPFRMWTRDAPRPSDSSTLSTTMAGRAGVEAAVCIGEAGP